MTNQIRKNLHLLGVISNIKMFKKGNNKLPHYNSIMVKEVIGEEIIIMIDNGATRSFIKKGFVVKNFPTKDVEGIYVTNVNDYYTICNKIVRLRIKMGDYILEDDFYIFPQDGLYNFMIGFQWMYPLGDVQIYFQTQEFRFNFKGKKVIIKGVRNQHELWFSIAQ